VNQPTSEPVPKTRAGWVRTFPATWLGLIVVGLLIGAGASLLQWLGNPTNMGLCIACFERDIAGAIGLHRFAPAQYLRPEIFGILLGAFAAALVSREYRPCGGAAPLARFALGFFAMVGVLVFMGCPWRLLLRLGGGDGTALAGLAGMVTGVGVGGLLFRRGYTLGRPEPAPLLTGLVVPGVATLMLALAATGFSVGPGGAIFDSARGPGAMHAPFLVSLGAGLVLGVLLQRSRFCTVGPIRKATGGRDLPLLSGVAAVVVGAMAVNLVVGQFQPGMAGMPMAHSDHLWNFLAMALTGLAFCLAGGCPGRQLVLCAQGHADAAVFILGALVGAGVAHAWFFAAGPDKVIDGAVTVGGPGLYGKIAVVIGLAFCLALGLTARQGHSQRQSATGAAAGCPGG